MPQLVVLFCSAFSNQKRERERERGREGERRECGDDDGGDRERGQTESATRRMETPSFATMMLWRDEELVTSTERSSHA